MTDYMQAQLHSFHDQLKSINHLLYEYTLLDIFLNRKQNRLVSDALFLKMFANLIEESSTPKERTEHLLIYSYVTILLFEQKREQYFLADRVLKERYLKLEEQLSDQMKEKHMLQKELLLILKNKKND